MFKLPPVVARSRAFRDPAPILKIILYYVSRLLAHPKGCILSFHGGSPLNVWLDLSKNSASSTTTQQAQPNEQHYCPTEGDQDQLNVDPRH